ncbi:MULTISPECIES: sugar phosphate isomerase/epimerase family protein [unclassified Sphingobium]|uniref:sugar phosphate isomerase/epimerase family protein n=1 Tax=unclassified Sphingobium TaxID=2611147 RepID=UPI002224293F|nr:MULTISPECIES: sugar phosphate isomerase/epimerase [unclassified Sphingobium]MCW2380650.1 sugar phosphate isomerase/epimerase [Sphingobium sp. B2D3B]MCW2399242.1 sugar phosphate isomerase/epimerase [Sphingobium sp. B2D3C]
MSAFAAGCTPSLVRPAAEARPLGLASITVAQALQRDYAGTLKAAKAMGYTHFGFPLAALSPRQPPAPDPVEVAAMVRDAGLSVGVVRLGYGVAPAMQMATARKIGATIVAQSAAPVFFEGAVPGKTTRAAFEAWLPRLNDLARAAHEEGLRLVFHNHGWDHVPLEGKTPLALIAERFAPGEVDFEIDLAWAALGGAEPLRLVRALGPRVLTMHFKDVDPSRGPSEHDRLVPPGDGILNYARLIPLLDRMTNAIGYVEVDAPEDEIAAAGRGAVFVQRVRRGSVSDR